MKSTGNIASKLPDSLFEVDGIRVVEKLGKGSSATVYACEKDGKRFAIKLANERDSSGKMLQRFRTEAALLQQIVHPTVVNVKAVGMHDNHPYTVMELVEGLAFLDRLEKGPLPVSEVIQIGIELADVCQAIHVRGFVHRDLQPANLFWNPGTSGLRLIDFGLAGEAGIENERMTVGTVSYMPPEQSGAINRPVDGRSDLYAIGILLYESLVGQKPFVGSTIGDVIEMHRAAPLPAFAPSLAVPAELVAIVKKLTMKDPDDRFQTAEGLKAALELVKFRVEQALNKAMEWPYLKQKLPAKTHLDFVGREKELKVLSSSWNSTKKGRGKNILITGTSGSGKSRLVGELTNLAKIDHGIILSAKCSELVPLGVVRNLFDSAAELLDVESMPTGFKHLVQKHAPLLARVSSDFLHRFGIYDQKPSVASKEVFNDAIASVVAALGDIARPALIFIDDLQWIDESSLEVLSHVARLLAKSYTMFALTSRDGNEYQSVLALLKEKLGRFLSDNIEVGALSPDDSATLVKHTLGGLITPDAFSAQVFSHTTGNPFAIGEYLRSVVLNGVLAPKWGYWHFDQERLNELDLPTNIIDLLKRRISGLKQGTRSALTAAAVIGLQFDKDVLVQVSDLTAAEIEYALVEGRNASIIGDAGKGSFRFTHDRVHEAFLDISEGFDVDHLHIRIALVLSQIKDESFQKKFEIARHYWLGAYAQSPGAAFKANVEAATAALVSHDLNRAYQFFKNAETIATGTGIDTGDIQEYIADLCGRMGLKSEAITRFSAALRLAKTKVERSRLHGKLSRTHVANLDTDKGIAEIHAGFRELGWSFPNIWLHAIPASFNTFKGVLSMLTGIRYGKAKGQQKEIYEVVVDLHEQAGFLKFFEIDPITSLLSALRVFHIGHYLGESPSLVRLYTHIGLILGILKQRTLLNKTLDFAVQMAENLKDPQLVAHIEAYRTFGLAYRGDEIAVEYKAKAMLSDYKNTLSAENYMYLCGIYMSSLVLRGFAKEALACALTGIEHLKRTAHESQTMLDHYLTWCHTYAMSSLVMLGRDSEAQSYRDKLELYFNEHPNDRYHWGIHLNNLAQVHYEKRETSDAVEHEISRQEELGLFIPLAIMHVRHFYVAKAYIRMNQLRTCPQQKRAATEKLVKAAIWELLQSCDTQMFKSHYHAIKAAYYVWMGAARKAEKHLQKSDYYANRTNNPTVFFENFLTKSRREKRAGRLESMTQLAHMAVALARQHGWYHREQQVIQEFNLKASSGSSRSREAASMESLDLALTSVGSRSNNEGVGLFQMERSLEAFIKVSIASAASFDLLEQSTLVLDAVTKVFGAERAALFLTNDANSIPKIFVGRTSSGETFRELKNYSTKVIERVCRERRPLVLSGTEEGEALGSESILLHDLRSIMAAPVSVNGNFLGLVYLDTRLAKGMFKSADLKILNAIGIQVGIAIESARASKLEVERQKLEKDLELTGVVQKFLIPSERDLTTKHFGLRAFFGAADQAGGDWMWYEADADGTLNVLLGDATGHGPGPAIITGLVAGIYRTGRACGLDLPGIMAVIDQALKEMTKGEFFMTFSCYRFDAKKEQVEIINAGGPPALFIAKDADRSKKEQVPSSPLGTTMLAIATKVVPFTKGTRVLIYTDGAYEFEVNGRKFGQRGLSKLFESSASQPIAAAFTSMTDTVEELMANNQDDDVSMIVVERY